jgi:staphylococcal nuclease domain-containing protein 1
MSSATATAATAPPTATRPTILPARGVARVKNVMSGDTVVLLGKATTLNGKPPEVMFTMEMVTAPR